MDFQSEVIIGKLTLSSTTWPCRHHHDEDGVKLWHTRSNDLLPTVLDSMPECRTARLFLMQTIFVTASHWYMFEIGALFVWPPTKDNLSTKNKSQACLFEKFHCISHLKTPDSSASTWPPTYISESHLEWAYSESKWGKYNYGPPVYPITSIPLSSLPHPTPPSFWQAIKPTRNEIRNDYLTTK